MRSLEDGRHDFDFLHGEWNVHNRRLVQRLQGSDEWQEFEASAAVRPILAGLGNFDTISAENIPEIGRFEGVTLRLFDPGPRRWSIHWASTASPGRLDPPLTGTFDDGRGIFYGEDVHDGQPVRVRFEWLAHDVHPSWRQAFSPDDGRTWEVNWIMEFTRAA